MNPQKQNKKSKNMSITYVDLDFNKVKQKDETFSGFVVVRDTGKVSHITEFSNGDELGKISFRPTKEPLIFNIQYRDGYTELRYNNGSVSSVYNTKDNFPCGEYIRYDITGNHVVARVFYFDNMDVTSDIISFIGFSGSYSDFNHYELSEDEIFNITVCYGGSFKFHHEIKRSSSRFDEIVRNCIK